MTCENSKNVLQGYFDGELDLVRSLEFETHLKSCPEFAKQIEQQRSIRQSMRAANLYDRAPDSLRNRIRASLPREMQGAPMVKARSRMLEWLAVAATVLIAVLLGVKTLPRAGEQQQAALLAQEMVAGHIRSLQPGHLFDVESTDQHTVKPWFDGKVQFAPPVVDLKDQGFPLVGGRLDYVGSNTTAALIYGRQKHIINIFVWPKTSQSPNLPDVQTIQGYNEVFWSRNDMNFCAVSDLNIPELHQLVDLLQK